MTRFGTALLGAALAALPVSAQPKGAGATAQRYELGRRVKHFETQWEKHDAPAGRRRALAHLLDLTPQFFAFQFGAAGRSLDRAALALATDDDPAASREWVWSLYAVPNSRLIGGGAKELTVTVHTFYAVKGEPPKGLEVQLWFTDKQIVRAKPDKFPFTVTVPVPPLGEFAGLDRKLYFMAEAGKEIRRTAVGVSQVADLGARVAALKKAVGEFKALDTPEKATARDRARLLDEALGGAVPETDLPLADLLANAEAMCAGKPFFTPARPGQFWLSLPLGGNKTAPVRLFVPRGLDPSRPVPVVVALHGAGGSENLFFEGYGAGHIVRECERRGWLLVATRSGLNFGGGGPPVPEVVEQLGKRYPIDGKRVFLVGHSMGAMQSVALAQRHPGAFAAVAALGGGGGVKDAKAFAALPVFVGVGDKDFALGSARALNKALAAAGARNVTFKEYPEVEHMVIVREALPDVFALFDARAK